jgi:hypothetical protein
MTTRGGLVAAAFFVLSIAPANAQPDDLLFVPLPPCRVIDTRSASGGGLAPDVARPFFFRGPTRNYSASPNQGGNSAGCGIPDLTSDGAPEENLAKAVALNIVAVSPQGPGHLTAWPTNQAAPLASVLNFAQIGTNLANGVVLPLCDQVGATPCGAGDITFRASGAAIHLVVDVVGYFHAGSRRYTLTNTALGADALQSVVPGADPYEGSFDTAVGYLALGANTTGRNNTATGAFSLRQNTLGYSNTANGTSALFSNTTGIENTASGAFALQSNTVGNWNTAHGMAALRLNTGHRNTAVGHGALEANTSECCNTAVGTSALRFNTASLNTAVGDFAMQSNTTGAGNTASGQGALFANTTGADNVATGVAALFASTTASRNTAVGSYALTASAGERNTAVGSRALAALGAGSHNTALGDGAGASLTAGNHNIFVGNPGTATDDATIRLGVQGTQTRAFLAGVRGVTTATAGITVLVDTNGQLGTVSSSLALKQDVQEVGRFADRLHALHPVAFRYRSQAEVDPAAPLEFGLIAEEVAESFPELVVLDADGRPETVRYHLLTSLLLAELQRQRRELDAHAALLEEQRALLESYRAERGVPGGR